VAEEQMNVRGLRLQSDCANQSDKGLKIKFVWVCQLILLIDLKIDSLHDVDLKPVDRLRCPESC
jgi:hypothetical protein